MLTIHHAEIQHDGERWRALPTACHLNVKALPDGHRSVTGWDEVTCRKCLEHWPPVAPQLSTLNPQPR